MWYDLLVLAILGFFTLRGAARGLLTQLASIAAIVVCLVFAESISAAFGPMVKLDPPLNHWVVMFGAYLVCSFIAFGFARVLTDWVERAKLDSFNQHLGAVFGLLKGGVLCLVMTFFLVTLSPAARSALASSKSAYAAAYIMDRIHPVMPEKINEALAKYLQAYESGRPESPTKPGPGAADPNTTPANPWLPVPGGPYPGSPTQPGGAGASSPPIVDAGQAIDLFISQLPASVSSDLRSLIGRSLANTPPDQRVQAQQQLWNMVRQARPEDLRDLQSHLLHDGRQTLGDAIARWMGGFVAPSKPVDPGTPTGTGSNIPTAGPFPPPAGASPPPLASGPSSRDDQLLIEISRAYSSIPPVQLQVQADIRRRLTGLPPGVAQAVLEDWRRDLWQPQGQDPDPGTDANATLEVRIVRQLQARNIPLNRLSSEVQDRLEGAVLR